MIDAPGIYDVPELEYQADPVAESSLSVSGAKTILKSPARFHWERQHGRPNTKSFDFGHAAHAKVLGVGLEVATVPADLLAKNGAASTAAAKEWAADATARGAVILKAEDVARVDAMAAELATHPIASALFRDGTPEQSIFWRDDDTKVMLRGRTDWVTRLKSGRPVVVDYKTADDANPDEFRWDAGRYGYHMQDAWYREGMDTLTGESHAFLFVVQEKTAPFLVSVIELDDDARDVGAQRNTVARRTYLDCMTRDEWPGYPPQVHRVSIPNARYAPETETANV